MSTIVGVVLPQPIPFGKYTLFERIGRGGMADVFKARVQGPGGFERIFVIKRILPHLCDDPSFTKMFIEEAKLAARLNHPNIVQVFELGSVDNEYFMSMEYVRGRDLAETMRTLWARVGPPRPELVAYVGREMCRALAYAHDFTADDGTQLGMIHRDISPSNVMLSYDGAVKLLDFGIAKALGGEPEEATKAGTLKGKFAYMAPEQTVSNDFDRRIDIFATGIVLHEILTGRRLFKGENDLQTIERVRICDVPPPSLHNPLCPPELDSIVLQALAKHQEERFQSAFEMADALDDVVHAARFQPAHLAQAMRGLFPAETGGHNDLRNSASSSRLVGTSLTGTASVSPSRPHSSASWSGTGSRSNASNPHIVSTTVPPVTGGSVLTPSVPTPVVPAPYPPPPKRFFSRTSVWLTAAGVLILGAFLGGAAWMNKLGGTNPPHNGVQPPPLAPVATTTLNVNIQSNPQGADVFTAAGNVLLGRTPFRKQFIYQEALPTLVVFRLKGYHELVQEVRPGWSGEVALQLDVATATATQTATATATKHKSRTKLDDVDPFQPAGRRKPR